MISEHGFAETRLSAYQDGALPDSELRRVRTHLRGADAAARRSTSWRR